MKSALHHRLGFVFLPMMLVSALTAPVSGQVQVDSLSGEAALQQAQSSNRSYNGSRSLKAKTVMDEAENDAPMEDILKPIEPIEPIEPIKPIDQAEDKDNGKDSPDENWREKKNGFVYYDNGSKAVGLYKINGKFYLFDEKGIQRTGWQKYKGDYYYFQIANGQKGHMVRSKKINGITLAKDGKAVLSSESRAKLDILLKANEIVQKATKPMMEKPEKLKQSFDYLLSHYRYRGSPTFYHTAHWEQSYAQSMFTEGHGNCYAYGAAFAFLANAVGCKECYAVSSGGHGWAEVDGKIYDPSWSLTDRRHNYYGMSCDLSGVDGRPNYRRARRYVAKI